MNDISLKKYFPEVYFHKDIYIHLAIKNYCHIHPVIFSRWYLKLTVLKLKRQELQVLALE